MNQDDLNTFDQIGQELVSENGYYLGTGVDILYPVNGEACDWMYGTHGIFAYTPEVGSSSDGFWPATSRIIPYEENLYANQYLALVVGPSYSSSAYVFKRIFYKEIVTQCILQLIILDYLTQREMFILILFLLIISFF